ncbi:hypothetical protein CerSpe_008400 [Prunus speciosa]
MVSLWRPKANVQIIDIEDDRFVFSFPTLAARDTIMRGGPWTFNHSLLIMAPADGWQTPSKIPLRQQEFWVQAKGLPLVFMTRAMGKLIGDALGLHVVTDQSRRGECLGSYLRIRVLLDVSRPLRRWLAVRLPDDSGTVEWVQLRYEKLPITCFLCGMMDHGEKECGLYTGGGRDDGDKPYGMWFQHDVLGPDYRKPKGRRFGLNSSEGWTMRAPMDVDGEETAALGGAVKGDVRADVEEQFGHENHALMAYDLGSGIHAVEGASDEVTKSRTSLPDLNGPPEPAILLETDSVGPPLDVIAPAQDRVIDPCMQLTLGPFIRETSLGDSSQHALGSGAGSPLLRLDRDPPAPPSGPVISGPVNDDPFDLSPIIRRITAQDRVDRGKRPSRSMGRRGKGGPRRGGLVNPNGKRNLSMVAQLDGMQLGKRTCLSSASSRSLMGSAEVGEAQPRREP